MPKQFVVGGQSGRVGTSPDGFTWTNRGTPLGAVSINDVCWSESLGLWLIVGHANGVITSPDGITWTSQTSGFSGSPAVQACLWVEAWALFIIGGDSGNLATSPDGIIWTTRTSGFSGTIFSIAYSPTLGLAVAADGTGATARSSNGTTWTAATSLGGCIFTVQWWGDASRFVAGGSPNSGGSKAAFTSTDGSSWSTYSSGVNTARDIYCGFGNADHFSLGSGGGAELKYRTIGSTTWNTATSGGGSGQNMNDIIYVAELDLWLWVGRVDVVAFTSTDGITGWTLAGQSSPFTEPMNCIGWGGSEEAVVIPTNTWRKTMSSIHSTASFSNLDARLYPFKKKRT